MLKEYKYPHNCEGCKDDDLPVLAPSVPAESPSITAVAEQPVNTTISAKVTVPTATVSTIPKHIPEAAPMKNTVLNSSLSDDNSPSKKLIDYIIRSKLKCKELQLIIFSLVKLV